MRAPGCSIISNQPDPGWSSHSHPGTSSSCSSSRDTRQAEAGSSHSLARVSGPVSMCRVWARLGAATPAMNAAWFLQFPHCLFILLSIHLHAAAACTPMMLQVVWPAADCHNGLEMMVNIKCSPTIDCSIQYMYDVRTCIKCIVSHNPRVDLSRHLDCLVCHNARLPSAQEQEQELVPLRGASVMFLLASPGGGACGRRMQPPGARRQETHKYQYRISRVSRQ